MTAESELHDWIRHDSTSGCSIGRLGGVRTGECVLECEAEKEGLCVCESGLGSVKNTLC